MANHGKRYRNARAMIDRERLYSPLEAVRIVKEVPPPTFDETVEAHFRLGLNVRHADQQLRGTLMLPHGTGRETRVAVFAEGEKAKEAEEAGADVVGTADLAQQIEGGFDDFDVAIATPDQMGNVGRLGRILGPRGKMPNPKTGTVTFDVRKEELRRAGVAGELRDRPRGDPARQARRCEGPLRPRRHSGDHHGAGHQGRSLTNAGGCGRARGFGWRRIL